MRYIALLRGINVSGKNMLGMPALKAAFEKKGYKNIWTYIQSGNIAFSTEKDLPDTELVKAIETLISKEFNMQVPVIVRNGAEISSILSAQPFPGADENFMHVTLLSDVPEEKKISKIDPEKYLPDRFTVIGREIYLFCPGGYGNTKLNNNFFESKLKVRATTRNFRTMKTIRDHLK